MKTILMAAGALALAAAATAATAQAVAPQTIGVARAVSAAESATGGRAFEAELDHEGGAPVYEVSLVKHGRAVEAHIDAVTGRLVRQTGGSALRMPFTGANLRAAQTAPRSLSQTIAMVEGATKAKVADIGLEQHRGRHYYEVELVGAQDREVRVDLQTGAITPMIDD